jgi:hypothetical protein
VKGDDSVNTVIATRVGASVGICAIAFFAACSGPGGSGGALGGPVAQIASSSSEDLLYVETTETTDILSYPDLELLKNATGRGADRG